MGANHAVLIAEVDPRLLYRLSAANFGTGDETSSWRTGNPSFIEPRDAVNTLHPDVGRIVVRRDGSL